MTSMSVKSFFSQDRGQIWKFRSTGMPDPSFAVGSVANVAPMPDTPTEITAMTAVGDGTGRVYIGGLFSQHNNVPVNSLIRVNPNRDARSIICSARQRRLPNGSGNRWEWRPLYPELYPNRTDTIRGRSLWQCFNPDGTRDLTFTRPNIEFDFSSMLSIANVDDGSGDLFIAGTFVQFTGGGPAVGGLPLEGFVRINADGIFDETSPHPNAGWGSSVDQGAGRLWRIDRFAGYNGFGTGVGREVPGTNLQRYKIDGPVDAAFTPGVITGSGVFGVNVILPTPDGTGDLYVAGNFTT